MIELAWLWLRHQPDSPLSVWFRERRVVDICMSASGTPLSRREHLQSMSTGAA
jgi:hypothetical protein